MLQEAHRVMKPGSMAYFSVLCDFKNSSVFSALSGILKKYGFVSPNMRTIFHLSEDETLKSIFSEDLFEIVEINKIYLKMDLNPKIVGWNSLDNYAEFVNSLDEDSRKKLIKEHSEMTEALNSGKKPLDFNTKAIIVKRK